MLRGDVRGQAVQVGAILLFGALILSLSIYQASVIPQENKAVEFDAYQEGEADRSALGNALREAASRDAPVGVEVRLGARYPPRTLFTNPPPSTGSIETATGNVSISGAVTAGEDAADYWNGTTMEFAANRLVYRPGFNEFDAPPTTMTGWYAYRDYGDGRIPLTSQSLVQGNRISLVAVEGDLRASGTSASLLVTPVSAPARTVTVGGRDGADFNLTVETDIPAEEWEASILAAQMAPDGHVKGVADAGEGAVNVTLDGGQSYELRLAAVDVREQREERARSRSDAAYVVSGVDKELSTNADGKAKLVVEVRDRFNNPVSNADVTFNASSGTFESYESRSLSPANTTRTDDRGRAVVWYNATGRLGTIPVDAYLGAAAADWADAPAHERLTYSVFNTVVESGNGGGGSGEQAGRALVVLDDVNVIRNAPTNEITFTINNTGEFPVNMTGYRLDYLTMIEKDQFSDAATAINQTTLDPGGSAPQPRPGTADDSVAVEGQSPYFFGDDPVEIAPGEHDLQVLFNEGFELGTTGNDRSAILVSFSIYLEGDITVTFTVHITP